MLSSDFFNLLPAFIWWLIAAAFVVLWRIRITTWYCSVGFALTGTGFALDAYPIWGMLNPLFSGAFYIIAVWLYSGCVLDHFEMSLKSRRRLALPLIFAALHLYLLFGAQAIDADLLLIDVAFAMFLGDSIILSWSRARSGADRFLLVSTNLVAADCVMRSVLFTIILPGTGHLEDFASSNYSVAVQITTLTVGLLFPMAVLAAAAARAIERHRADADTDPLTGLLNRRGFFRLTGEAHPHRVPSGALLVADIDHFKQVNDRFGHIAGDGVIRALAAELRRGLPADAIIARFGGEEFVAYVPGYTASQALGAATAVAQDFSQCAWRDAGIAAPVTVSIGVTDIDASEASVDPAIDRADKALYAAKDAGRNRVIVNSTNPGCTIEGIHAPRPDGFPATLAS